MGRGSSSRGSSSRRNPHGGFHRVATNVAGGGRERHRVNIDANEAYRLNQRYESAPHDVMLPEGWHLNPNRVPILPPPAIADRKRRSTPEQLADPRYAGEGPAWDELFQAEHEAARKSFFAAEPPEWFLRDSVSPPSSDNEDATRSDSELYKRLPEEIPPQGWRKKGPDGGSGSSPAPVVIID